MSLFNKISGLALKARDNVVSKTFVSKDRRLEQSLSDKVDLAEIFFEKMSTYGLPSHIHVIAYDSVAGLLAVAGSSKQGYIKVFGKGISSTIPLPNQVGVKHLQFRTGSPTLVVIDNTNAIITLDLRSNSVQNVVMAPEIITSIEYCMGTDWLFIGYANGFVDVFDILQGVITQYQISDLLPEEDTGSHVVIDLKMHPSDLNTLLIGYESGAMIWSIKEKIVRKTFSLSKLDSANPFRKGRLTCFAWSPSGTRFIGGYDDGCIHLWDTRNDQKPACSRKLLQAQLATSPTEEDAANDTAADPIYQIAWYINESTHKSCVIVAGGIQSADICGLTLLEYDLDSEPKEPKKQTIIPLQDDLSQFLMLSSDPYYQGMYNPLGIAIIDVHGGLQVLNLIEHGYPLLKLPPAIEFLGPDVLNACHLPQIPDVTFRKLAQFTNADKETKYFPITGGLTGPDHVYKFESNDLLLTIHRGELVKFWDASFVALRPLSHLTIRCLDEVSTPQSFIRCLDLNKTTGHVSMGFNDGSIVLYKYRRDRFQPETNDPKIVTRNDLFINNCDDTLKDLNELLDGMDSTESVDDQGVHEHTPDVQQPPPEPPTDSKIFHKLQREGDSAGFYPSLKITLSSSIDHIASIDTSILVVTTEDGQLSIFDIDKQLTLMSVNISQFDFIHTINKYDSSITAKIVHELEDMDNTEEIQKKPAKITSLHFFDTYAPAKVMSISTQLFVGLGNGHVYQFNASSFEKTVITQENINDYLAFSLHPSGPILQTFAVNLKGESQEAIKILSKPLEQHQLPEEEAKALSKESSQNSSSSEKEDQIPKPNTNTQIPLYKDTSKRMAAIGKAEYRYQDDPHLIIFVTKTTAQVMLSGYNVKLFSKEFRDEHILQSQIIFTSKGVCLCLLFNLGRIGFYSLPLLDMMLETQVPKYCSMSRLNEASISSDGRMVTWTGKYEMKQFSFVKQPDRHIGESIILYDPQRSIPLHPSLVNQQKTNKKTWLTTVAGAFQKEALTLDELDTLMGRIPTEDPTEIRKQRIEAAKNKAAESSKSSGPGGLFAELGNKMNERGERIGELDQKMQEMNAASGDFLKAVKDYNERQARKKWWEF